MRRYFRSRLFTAGLLIFGLGSGPLLLTMLASSLGLTRDPKPNPVGFGIMALFTFWPGLLCMAAGIARVRRAERERTLAE